MKWWHLTLWISMLGIAGVQADLSPEAWHSEQLPTAGTGANRWYIRPDLTNSPNLIVKNASKQKFLNATPPVWDDANATNASISGQGVYVPRSDGGGYLVAPNGTASLKVMVIGPNGAGTVETIDNYGGGYTAISAALEPASANLTRNERLHVAYVRGGSILGYARRSGTGANPWILPPLEYTANLGFPVSSTAVVPATDTSVNLYFTLTQSGVTTLKRAQPTTVNGFLLVTNKNFNPLVDLEQFVQVPLCGTRIGNTDRVYYVGSGGNPSATSWKFRRWLGSGSDGEGQTVEDNLGATLAVGSIHAAISPDDGIQRVAWYNNTTKNVHYLKPTAPGVDYLVAAGHPITFSGASSDLLGFQFDSSGRPYLLYQTTNSKGYVAFPTDDFDFNANGRPDLLDSALGSTTARLEALPVAPAAAGVANSADRFKFRLPTVGSALWSGGNTLVSNSSNLTYAFELSEDGETWESPADAETTISFTKTAESGTDRTYVGVVNTPAPGEFTSRFARLRVSRTKYPY
ncbi:hypothetical protein [Luteolibacter marinus]|uniref:hypothetical protein n=1 Tax=Luteolibacter marinus TaxID=2776705 RepID=UPI00186644ED|nr:hypothetical protein [Luteolibacter marinus]